MLALSQDDQDTLEFELHGRQTLLPEDPHISIWEIAVHHSYNKESGQVPLQSDGQHCI